MYDAYVAVITDVFTDLGLQALAILGAGVLLAGGVFLIRWGFKKAKAGLSGQV